VRRPVARPPPAGQSGVRPAVLPRLVPRQVVEEVLAEVFELRSDAARVEEEHAKVVGGALLAVFARLFRARALRDFGLGGDQEGKDAGALDAPGVPAAIIGPDFYRPRGPHVVQVDGAVSGAVVVVRARVRVSVPGDVQLFASLRLHLFEAGDELAVGRLRVVCEAARQGPDGLEEELLLLVPDSREVRDLRCREVFDSDVDVLARAGRGLGSGVAQGAHHLLQGVEVFPVQDGRYHLRRGGAAAEAAVADRLPLSSVGRGDRPGVVAPAGVADVAADHALDCSGCAFAADVGVFELRSEAQGFRGVEDFVLAHVRLRQVWRFLFGSRVARASRSTLLN